MVSRAAHRLSDGKLAAGARRGRQLLPHDEAVVGNVRPVALQDQRAVVVVQLPLKLEPAAHLREKRDNLTPQIWTVSLL